MMSLFLGTRDSRAGKTEIVVGERHIRAASEIVAENGDDILRHSNCVNRQISVKIDHHASVEENDPVTIEEHLRHHSQLDSLKNKSFFQFFHSIKTSEI